MSGKIEKLFKSDVKCDDQQQYKYILEAENISAPEGFTYNSPMSPVPSVTVKNPSCKDITPSIYWSFRC